MRRKRLLRVEVVRLLREALQDMPTCPHSRHGCCDDVLPNHKMAWCSTCQVAVVLRDLSPQDLVETKVLEQPFPRGGDDDAAPPIP